MPANSLARVVYRALLRHTQQLSGSGNGLTIRSPVDRTAYQRHAQPTWTLNDAASRQDLVEQLLPHIGQIPKSGVFTPETLRSCIRANFAAAQSNAPMEQQGALLDNAFAALRTLSEQMLMQQCSSHTVTQGISVDVTSAFSEKVPRRDHEAFAFTYRVRVSNIGDTRTQLLSRHWVIKDDQGQISNEVKGPGVIGNTPMLKPYDCFEYYSAAILKSKEGSMEGSFQMLRTSPEKHEHFDAQIQPFRLIGPK